MYYILLAITYPLSLLPLKVLYLLSDLVRVILFGLVGYRKKIVRDNLRQAFPEKNLEEISQIEQKFYRSFCDQWIETLKLLTMSQTQLKKRVTGNWDIFWKLNEEGKNAYVLLGHQFNWEMSSLAYKANTPQEFLGIYLPLSGKAADRLMLKIRKRTGALLAPASNLAPAMKILQDKTHVIGFIADQSPGAPNLARWYRFLNRPAPFMTGAEKGARRAGAVAIVLAIHKLRRGYYDLRFEVICDNAAETKPGFITERYVRHLEADIRRYPDNWLWTHRRWKIAPAPGTFINE